MDFLLHEFEEGEACSAAEEFIENLGSFFGIGLE